MELKQRLSKKIERLTVKTKNLPAQRSLSAFTPQSSELETGMELSPSFMSLKFPNNSGTLTPSQRSRSSSGAPTIASIKSQHAIVSTQSLATPPALSPEHSGSALQDYFDEKHADHMAEEILKKMGSGDSFTTKDAWVI